MEHKRISRRRKRIIKQWDQKNGYDDEWRDHSKKANIELLANWSKPTRPYWASSICCH